jgi:hypothetical protein
MEFKGGRSHESKRGRTIEKCVRGKEGCERGINEGSMGV